MLIKFFKSSYPGQYISLIILMALLWMPSFFKPPEMVHFKQLLPLWDLLFTLFSGAKTAVLIFNFLITFSSALMLNYVLTSYNLISKNHLTGAFTYVLYTGVFIPVQPTGPLPLVNLFLLMLINVLLKLYDEKEGYRTVFSAGFIISVLFLLYPPLVFLIIPVYFVIILMGNVKWRELFIPLAGFALPLAYTLAYYYLTERSGFSLQDLLTDVLSLDFISLNFDVGYWILISLSLLLFLLSLFNMLGNIGGKNIDLRKSMTSILHFLFFMFFIFLLIDFEHRNQTLLLVPLSMVIAWHFSEKRKTIKLDIIVWVILAVGLFRHIYLVFFNHA